MAESTLSSAAVKTIDTSGPPVFGLHKLGQIIQELQSSAGDHTADLANLAVWSYGVPLESVRALVSSDIQTLATAHVGILGSNTAIATLKALNGSTNRTRQIALKSNQATGVAMIGCEVPLPTDMDGGAMYVYVRARKETGAATQTLVITTCFGEQSAKSSSAVTLTSAFAQYTHSITAGTVPATPSKMTIEVKNGISLATNKRSYISCIRVKGTRTY